MFGARRGGAVEWVCPMKPFFGDRFVRAVLAVVGLTATVGGPIPDSTPKLGAFTSNGCSVFPDGDTFGCCYIHDLAYWSGGTAADRRRADRRLEQCVADVTGNHAIGGVMYLGVTLFGLPGVPTRVQWGYGWEETRQTSYAPLSADERAQVDARKQELCRTFVRKPDTGNYAIDGRHWIRAVDARLMCPGS
jgi:hypothetical protein